METVALLRLALQVLSERMMTIIGLCMKFALACWTMHEPTYERLGMSAFFACFAYLIVKTKEKSNEVSERN